MKVIRIILNVSLYFVNSFVLIIFLTLFLVPLCIILLFQFYVFVYFRYYQSSLATAGHNNYVSVVVFFSVVSIGTQFVCHLNIFSAGGSGYLSIHYYFYSLLIFMLRWGAHKFYIFNLFYDLSCVPRLTLHSFFYRPLSHVQFSVLFVY